MGGSKAVKADVRGWLDRVRKGAWPRNEGGARWQRGGAQQDRGERPPEAWLCGRGRSAHLRFRALQAAADGGVPRPVQHAAQLLAQLKGGGAHQARGLAAQPDEHVGPTVQDVHTARVQQALQLQGKGWRSRPMSRHHGGLPSAPLPSSLRLTSRILGISSTLGRVLCSTESL